MLIRIDKIADFIDDRNENFVKNDCKTAGVIFHDVIEQMKAEKKNQSLFFTDMNKQRTGRCIGPAKKESTRYTIKKNVVWEVHFDWQNVMHESILFLHRHLLLLSERENDNLKEIDYLIIQHSFVLPSLIFPASFGIGLLDLIFSRASGKISKQNGFVRSSSVSRIPTSINGIIPRRLSISFNESI